MSYFPELPLILACLNTRPTQSSLKRSLRTQAFSRVSSHPCGLRVFSPVGAWNGLRGGLVCHSTLSFSAFGQHCHPKLMRATIETTCGHHQVNREMQSLFTPEPPVSSLVRCRIPRKRTQVFEFPAPPDVRPLSLTPLLSSRLPRTHAGSAQVME
jgi:hypothetical protein